MEMKQSGCPQRRHEMRRGEKYNDKEWAESFIFENKTVNLQ